MSAATGGDDQQTIQLTPEEVLVLRGAMNVAEEVLEQPGLEIARRFPITTGQLPTIRALKNRLESRVEGTATVGGDRVQETLTPAEAQAVRDVAGLLEFLLQDAGGREILVQIGWLRSADQPVDQEEIDALMTVMDMVDPTGVRPERTEPQRELGEIIDPTLSLEAVLANAEDEIVSAGLPWPGFEQATFHLQGAIDSFAGGRTTLGCETILKNLVVVTKLALAGQQHFQGQDRQTIGEWAPLVDEAYLSVMSSVEVKHCVNRNAQETLWDHIDDVVNSVVSPQASQAARESARALIQAMQNMTVSGGIDTDFPTPTDDDQRLLNHITQLRADLEETLESARTPGGVFNENQVEIEATEALPSSRADCGELLASLAELVVLQARVVAFNEDLPRGQRIPLDIVANARRAVLEKMGFDDVFVNDSIPGDRRECFPQDVLNGLRDSLQSVANPQAADPDDVETRAFAALSDVRDAFQGRERGP